MLQLNKDGSFRILVIADVQDCRPLDGTKKEHLSRLICRGNPDLIVLLGDMLFGPLVWTRTGAKQIISSILDPIGQSQIPFAVVSGNHDQDARMPFLDQVEQYRESPLCLTPGAKERNCAGAWHLDVSDDQGDVRARLLFLDSGATKLTLSGIQYIPADQGQMEYTKALLSETDCPPVFVFQHIPVPEIYRLIKYVNAGEPGAVRGRGPNRGKYLALLDPSCGVMNESPCPPWENGGQFDAWVQSGKVKAAVFGHDQINSFTGKVENVMMIQTSCAGLSCYGRDELRGGRMLTVFPEGRFDTYPMYYREMK